MFIKRLLTLFFPVMGLLLVTSSTIAAQSRTPVAQPDSPSEYVIGNGDLVELRVFRQPDLSGKYRVSEKGTILVPLVGEVVVSGLTELQSSTVLRAQLDEYLQDPLVNVNVVEFVSQSVTVIGAVRNPGRFSLRGPTRVLDVVFQAGGFSSSAGQSLQVIRYGKPAAGTTPDPAISELVTVNEISLPDLLGGKNPEKNKLLEAGDLVRVSEADTIYVSGSVNKPGTYSGISLTLSQALVLAGGFTSTAQKNNISISRVSPGKPGREEIVCNFGLITNGKAPDPLLQANDVVFVRNSERRSLVLNTTKAMVTSFVAVLPLVLLR